MDFARRIYEGLKGEVSDSGGKVVLQRTFQAYSDGVQSQAQGAALKATLVIWGWYDDGGVSPRIELLRIPSLATQPLDLPFIVTSAFAAEPAAASPALRLSDVAHYIRTPLTMPSVDVFVKDGPQQMAYVSTMLLGLIYYANGDAQHALAYLDKALANSPAGGGEIVGQEVAHFQRAVVHYQQNRLIEAQADLEQALSIKSDFYEAHHNLAILYAATCSPARRLDEAIVQAQTAARLKPDSAEAHQLLGDLYRQAGRPVEAVAEIETASRLDPNSALIKSLLASVYDEAGHADKAQSARAQAIALYQSALTAKGSRATDPLEAHLSLGDAYTAAGKYDEVLAEYPAAQKAAPSDARVYRGLGNAYFWKGQLSDAEREYRHWTALAPQDATARLLLGVLYQQQGRKAEALPELEQAADLAGCSAAEHIVLAGAYYDAADYPHAIAEYQAATRTDPRNADAFYLRADFPQAYFALGSAYTDLRQPDKAAGAFEAVAEQRPQESAYDAAEAHAYWDLQRWEDAAAAYQKALALHDDANLRIFLGQVHEKLGRNDAASAEYQRGLALDPHNKMGWSSLAALYARQGKLADAASAYQQALANGDDPTLRGLLAFVYLRQGNTDAAAEQFSQAAALDPANATARLMLGNLLAQKGQLDQAATRYGEVLALQPGNADAHFEMALLQYKCCNLSAATEEARNAVELAPELSVYRGELGGLNQAQGREDEAVPVYASLQSAPASDVLAHLMVSSNLTRLYYKDKDGKHLDEAVHELEVSLEAAKDTPVIASFAHSALGQVYYAQKKFIAAQSEFQTALSAWDSNAEAQIGLGDIALRSGDTGAALTAYQQAGALLPAYAQQGSVDNARLLAVALSMRRGLTLARAGKREDATAALDQAAKAGQDLLALMPQWPQAHFALATVLLARDEPTQVGAEFAAASQCDASLATLRDPTEANLAELRGPQP